jgi:hypothetical protein
VISRRDVIALLAGGSVAASGLILPTRSIFLPPHGGWIVAQKRMEIHTRYAHIWQQELDSGTVTVDPSNPDHLQLWTSAPLESQPLKDWRQFITDWRKERGENFTWIKPSPKSTADAIIDGFRYTNSSIASASDSISASAASHRAAQIRAKMQADAIAARKRWEDRSIII